MKKKNRQLVEREQSLTLLREAGVSVHIMPALKCRCLAYGCASHIVMEHCGAATDIEVDEYLFNGQPGEFLPLCEACAGTRFARQPGPLRIRKNGVERRYPE